MKKITMIIFLLVCFVFIGLGKVNAEEYSISVDIESSGSHSDLKMYLNGEFEDRLYYVKLVNENDPKPSITSAKTGEVSAEDITKLKAVSTDRNGEININDDWYMLKGYNYAYVVKCMGTDSCEVVNDNPIEIEKPMLPSYTNRYKITFVAKELQAYSNFPDGRPFGINGSHTKVIKLGKITDNDVIRKLAKSESDAISSLMNYAVSADGQTFETNDSNLTTDTSSVAIEPKAYYYVYVTYKNDDGLYRDLSDVTVAQGVMHDGTALLSTDIDWGITDDGTSSASGAITNPKTNDIRIIAIISDYY